MDGSEVIRSLALSCIAALVLGGCATSIDCTTVQASENQSRINQLRMGQTLTQVERVMGKGPVRRHARTRFDGVAIEEWSYSTDPMRKLDTIITFVGGKVEEINTASWERRKKDVDPRESEGNGD